MKHFVIVVGEAPEWADSAKEYDFDMPEGLRQLPAQVKVRVAEFDLDPPACFRPINPAYFAKHMTGQRLRLVRETLIRATEAHVAQLPDNVFRGLQDLTEACLDLETQLLKWRT